MNIKKTLSLVMCIFMLAPLFISCNDKSNQSSTNTFETTIETKVDGTSTIDDSAETESEKKEVSAYDYLPKKDYESYNFRIMAPTKQTRYLPVTVVPEELTGEIIYDAAYERNLAVKDAYNINMVYVDGINNGDTTTSARKSILAGDDSIDIVINSLANSGIMASENLFLDINQLQYMATDMPWYSQNVNKNLQINGKLKTFASDFTCIFLACTYSLFFNQTMAYEQFNLPNIYDTVLAGTWTNDKLVEYSKSVSDDINGDGVMDVNDRYGFGFSGSMIPTNEPLIMQQYGMEQFTTISDEHGIPTLNINTERMTQVVEKLNTLYSSPDSFSTQAAWNDSISMFAKNQLLFLNCIIMHAPNYMRDMTDTYGVLPMPKFDENQTNYYTSISPGSGMLQGIPLTVQDPEKTSVIFEALTYEGYAKVIPAFFETSMKIKYSRDETSSKVFDILRDGITVDFGLVFDGGVGMSTIISHVIAGGGTGFTSRYAAIESATLAQYQSVMDSFNK